ncbi:unnamed protein product [Protopolystoma xenopodis]|uniref:Uncharacterized protein n=1 Tax=Protopolystoma xenopodis TaxID=117903 RepID=A0A448X347_9PLAT|nr:unnamed protein product [Protopolystoma xenopodis]
MLPAARRHQHLDSTSNIAASSMTQEPITLETTVSTAKSLSHASSSSIRKLDSGAITPTPADSANMNVSFASGVKLDSNKIPNFLPTSDSSVAIEQLSATDEPNSENEGEPDTQRAVLEISGICDESTTEDEEVDSLSDKNSLQDDVGETARTGYARKSIGLLTCINSKLDQHPAYGSSSLDVDYRSAICNLLSKLILFRLVSILNQRHYLNSPLNETELHIV